MLRKLRARLTLLCAALCGLVVVGISATALYATQTQYLDTCAQQNLRLATQLAARVAAEQSISRTVLSQTERDENAVGFRAAASLGHRHPAAGTGGRGGGAGRAQRD